MNVIINGTARTLADGASVSAAVRLVTEAAAGIAAAVNGQVVTRRSWDATPLADGDRVEVLTAVQGG
jgi:sulfur carrier protein